MAARVLQERHGEVMGGPLCEQHCALGQQGQWDELCCGLVGGMVHGQTAGPHPGGLHGLQDVLVDEPRDELRERSRGLAEQLSGLGEQMGGGRISPGAARAHKAAMVGLATNRQRDVLR